MKIGYTSGIFDLFHKGHENYLLSCKKLCDFLIVGVDSDLRTQLLKGSSRPINNILTRMKNVSPYCNYVFEKEESSGKYIEKFQPEVLFLSEENIKKTSNEKNNSIIYIPYTQGISTSLLLSLSLD